MKKKHELLKFAYDNYPKGTWFRPLIDGGAYISSGNFNIDDEGVTDSNNGHYIFEYGQWSEIVPTIIEVDFEEQRLPLLTSIDGVDLYEGDKYFLIKNFHATGYKWKLCRKNVVLGKSDFVITDSEICKAVSSKKEALKWVEKLNKPKPIVVKMYFGQTAIVNSLSGEISLFINDELITKISTGDINDIYNHLK